MRFSYLLVCAAILNGCGKEDLTDYIFRKTANANPNHSQVSINPSFIVYYQAFEQAIGRDPNRISIDFAKIDSPAVGLCYYYDDATYNHIAIDGDFWSTASDNVRQELVFHELGHCALGLGHDEATHRLGTDTAPNSIMFPYVFGDSWYYTTYRQNYFDELKNKR